MIVRIRRSSEREGLRTRRPDPDSSGRGDARRGSRGLTLLECLITLTVIGLLAATASRLYNSALDRARVTRAMADIRVIEKILLTTEVEGSLPESLDEIGWAARMDPWGRPYQFLNFKNVEDLPAVARADQFHVPLNTTFDLYSMGPDGVSDGPLTAAASRDDILRASDGSFVGTAADY